MSGNNDWIRDTAEQYYKEGCFKKSKFRKVACVSGDHYHCDICGQRLSQHDYSDGEKQGYYSSIDGTWFCTSCFEEYQKYRKLPTINNTVKMVQEALLEHKTVIISLNNDQYIIKNKGNIIVEHHGIVKEYKSTLMMEREQLFFGRALREAIDEIYLGIID